MAHLVTVAAGQTNIVLPDGKTYNAGQSATLTDAQFAQINSADFPSVLVDGGVAPDPSDGVVTQGADVANLVAATATAPAALTSPADLGAAYTQASVNALRADVAALRTTLAAVVVDLGAHATTINALDNNLTGPGKALA